MRLLVLLIMLVGTAPASAALTAVVGTRNTLIILVNFLDNNIQPISPADMKSVAFGPAPSLQDYYLKTSNGKILFTGDIYGWVTVPYNQSTTCSDYNTWSMSALSSAQASGIDTSKYQHLVYVYPANNITNTINCPMDIAELISDPNTQIGNAYVGPKVQTNGQFIAADGTGRYGLIQNMVHELGHNLGLAHAADYPCSTNKAIDIPANCLARSYNDSADPMAAASGDYGPAPMNAPHRDALGWFDANQVQTVASSGTFKISPLEVNDSNLKALRIKKADTNEYYYLSYRQYQGTYNNSFRYTNMLEGLSIHVWDGVSRGVVTKMLFARPWTFTSSGLIDGMRFEDGINGISITQISHDSTGVTISIQIGPIPCQNNNPLMTVNTTSKYASSVPYVVDNAGYLSRPYYLMLFNNNSVGCPAASMKINSVLPGSGWSDLLSGTSPILASQSYIFLTDQILSPLSSAFGNYPFSINSSLAGDPSYYSSASSSVNIVSGDVTPPSTIQNLIATIQSSKSVLLSWDPSTDNVGVTGYYISRYDKTSGASVFFTTSSNSFVDSVDTSHYLIYYVSAFDAANNSSVAGIVSLNVPPPTPTQVAPSITIYSPASGATVSKSVTVLVNVSSSVTKVELYVDGALVNSSISAPFTTTWTPSKNLKRGAHSLQCKAYDANGNTALSQFVTVYK